MDTVSLRSGDSATGVIAHDRFAVANVLDEDVKQLGGRLRQLNGIMGMTD